MHGVFTGFHNTVAGEFVIKIDAGADGVVSRESDIAVRSHAVDSSRGNLPQKPLAVLLRGFLMCHGTAMTA